MAASTQASVKIVKQFSYRGATKSYSNTYHLDASSVPDTTHWNTLFDNIVALEKACYPSSVTITGATGYNAGSDVPVASKGYSTAGTMTPGGNDVECPGDCCYMYKFTTTQRTSKNHPVYLFKYMKPAYRTTTGTNDQVTSTQTVPMNTFFNAWIAGGAGFSDGTTTYHLAGPRGAVAQTKITPSYISHRDFVR